MVMATIQSQQLPDLEWWVQRMQEAGEVERDAIVLELGRRLRLEENVERGLKTMADEVWDHVDEEVLDRCDALLETARDIVMRWDRCYRAACRIQGSL